MKTYMLGIVCIAVLAMLLCGLLFDTGVYFISVILCAAVLTARSIAALVKSPGKSFDKWHTSLDLASDILRNTCLVITVRTFIDVVENAAASDVSIAGFSIVMGLFIAQTVFLSVIVFISELAAIMRVYAKNEKIRRASRITSIAMTVLIVITAEW